ncbi:hypothetical protein LCGC14_2968140 [marine sediment metagenome]|uniref:Uncharacterized protein n=1 Tax=marine sediment metagenome TaxID=412755 RepID=A0A0F8XXN3_9ZZZZ
MSNQLEEIQKLYAKVKTYKIPMVKKEGMDQISVEINPLSLEDIGLLNTEEDLPPEELANKVIKLFAKSLGIDEGDAKKISVEFMDDISSAFMDANNFKDDDMKKTGIKDFIKKKQEQIKVNQEKANGESTEPAKK